MPPSLGASTQTPESLNRQYDSPPEPPEEMLFVRRKGIVSGLLSLLPLVPEAHREKNSNQLLSALHSDAPLSDKLWDDVAYLAGIYPKVLKHRMRIRNR
jgi:hypothetical protein